MNECLKQLAQSQKLPFNPQNNQKAMPIKH